MTDKAYLVHGVGSVLNTEAVPIFSGNEEGKLGERTHYWQSIRPIRQWPEFHKTL